MPALICVTGMYIRFNHIHNTHIFETLPRRYEGIKSNVKRHTDTFDIYWLNDYIHTHTERILYNGTIGICGMRPTVIVCDCVYVKQHNANDLMTCRVCNMSIYVLCYYSFDIMAFIIVMYTYFLRRILCAPALYDENYIRWNVEGRYFRKRVRSEAYFTVLSECHCNQLWCGQGEGGMQ